MFDHPPPIRSPTSRSFTPLQFDPPSRPIIVSHPIDPFLIFDLNTPTQIPKDLLFKFESKLMTIYSSLSNLNCYYPLKWTFDKGSYDQDIRDIQATSIGIWGKIYYWELKIIGGGLEKFGQKLKKMGFFQLRWPLTTYFQFHK